MFLSETLNKRVYDNQVYRTAIAICHNGIRRSSEPISEKLGGLKIENVIFVGGLDEYTPAPRDDMDASAILVFLFSKKNQFGETQAAPLLHFCQFNLICAYCELLNLWAWRKHIWKPHENLFIFENKSILTYNKFNKKLKDCGEAIGFTREDIKPHGLRSGGNLDLKLLQVNPNTRQIIAGWKDPKSRLKYEMKMEPHHLHHCLAMDLGLNNIKRLKGQQLQRIVSTRKDKLDRRKKLMLKQLKKQKSKIIKRSVRNRKNKRSSWRVKNKAFFKKSRR